MVFGLGETGWSVARYLHKHEQDFVMVDTRPEPPYLAELKREMPDVLFVGGISESGCADLLAEVDEVIMSPGLDLVHPVVAFMRERDIPIISDIEFWRRGLAADKAVLAISGSNGKSTVASLIAKMGEAQGLKVELGGNIGKPVLNLADDADIYVIEVSSFQLELTQDLNATVACLLNITPDHMERYANLQEYYEAKQRIFTGCKAAVYNREDKLTRPLRLPQDNSCFSGGQVDIGQFGIISRGAKSFLCQGANTLLDTAELKLQGAHNHRNILAALAVAELNGWELDKSLAVAKDFTGLPHRYQLVHEEEGVRYINDSKATNPDAARASLMAALNDGGGLSGELHLILGGSSKQADFSKLAEDINKHEKVRTYLIGAEAENLARLLPNKHKICGDLAVAVSEIRAAAKSGDTVLLAPACASFDQFANFAERGEEFTRLLQNSKEQNSKEKNSEKNN